MRPAHRVRIGAGVAALLVTVLAVWLVLRIVDGGSDASDASAHEQQHQAAAESLTRLAGTVADAGSSGIEGITSIENQSRSAQQVLKDASSRAAGSSNGALQLANATSTLVAALRAQAPIGTAQEAARSATDVFATTVTRLRTEQQRDAATAHRAAAGASARRSSALRYLVVLLLLTGATVVAVSTGLVPALTRPRSGRSGRDPIRHRDLDPARDHERLGQPVLSRAGGGGAAGPGSSLFDRDDPFGRAAEPAPALRLSSSRPSAGSPRPGSSARAGNRARLAATTSAHPGITLDAAIHAGLVVYAGSMIGPEHRGGKNFAPREDAYSWSPGLDPAVIVVAVADGVGSTRNSHAAALMATEVAVAQLRGASSGDVAAWYDRPELWREQALGLMTSVAGQLGPEQVDSRAVTIELSTGSSSSGQRPVAPATTLVVALGVVGADGVRVLWASVGDSQVSVLAPGAAHLSWSQPEGDAPSGTRALPRDAAHVISSQYFLPTGHAFLLTTDGCEKVLSLDASTVPLLHEMIGDPGDTRRLLELLQRTPPGAGDDRTLVLFAPGSRS